LDSGESILDVNVRTQHVKQMSGWRRLFLRFLAELAPRSVLDFGCGQPAFLASLPARTRRVGLDGNPGFALEYAAAGVEFHAFDFDREEPPIPLKEFDAAVCSDVFEHLLYPQRTLARLAAALAPEGVLFTHVPNEFRLGRTTQIMLGRAESVTFHTDCEEWNNPHLRRFTDRGFRKFLGLAFEHHLKLTDLNPSRGVRRMMRWRLPVPFCLEGGPTYASTRSRVTFERLVREKQAIRRRLGLS
jgi:SAM-dependent methyltransferase